jgi:hypothetical protein
MEPMKPPPIPPFNIQNPHLLKIQEIQPHVQTSEVNFQDRIFKDLTSENATENLSIIKDRLKKEIEDLNQSLSLQENSHPGLESMALKSLSYANGINEYTADATKLLPQTHGITTYQDVTTALSVANTTLETIINLAELIKKNKILQLRTETLKSLEMQTPQDTVKIQVLKQNIANLENEIFEMSKEFCLKVTLAAPGVAKNLYDIVKTITKAADVTGAVSSLGIAASIASVFASGYQLHEASIQFSEHAKHTTDLKLKRDPNPTIVIGQDRSPNNLAVNTKIHDHLKKRHEKLEARLKVLTPQFNNWLHDLMKVNVNDFNAFRKELEQKGIFLDKKIGDYNTFTDEFKNNPEFKKDLHYKYCESIDTMTDQAKALLKIRLEAQEKVNKRFFSFKLKKSKVLFAVTVITAIASIVLYASLAAGLVFPPTLFAIPAILGAGAAVGFIVLGMYHLYNNKPNLAKTMFRFVKLNILLNKIPLLFSEWRFEVAKMNQAEIQLKIDRGSTLSHDILEEYNNQKKEIDANVKFCEERFSKYKDKIAAMENEITQARIDDYKLNSGFNSFEKKGKVVYRVDGAGDDLKFTPLEETENLQDEFTVIAEALIKGQFWTDKEASKFIKKYAGLNIPENAQLNELSLTQDVQFLSQKLRDQVLRNSSDILEWINSQQINEVNA